MTRTTSWILWASTLGSLTVCALLPLLFPPLRSPPSPSLAVVGVLLGAAFALGLASLVLRQILLVRPAREGRLELDEAGERQWLQRSIVLWALSESVALAGLVLWVLYRQSGLLHPFLAGAALLLVIHAPRVASLERARSRAGRNTRVG